MRNVYLMHEMKRRNAKPGLSTLCISGYGNRAIVGTRVIGPTSAQVNGIGKSGVDSDWGSGSVSNPSPREWVDAFKSNLQRRASTHFRGVEFQTDPLLRLARYGLEFWIAA